MLSRNRKGQEKKILGILLALILFGALLYIGWKWIKNSDNNVADLNSCAAKKGKCNNACEPGDIPQTEDAGCKKADPQKSICCISPDSYEASGTTTQ